MSRVRGLSNERYAERKEAISETLRKVYEGDAAEPIPSDFVKLLDRMR
jgi:hypothetical protein